MNRPWVVAVVLAALGGVTVEAAAQQARRSGFWAEAGAGGGNIHIGCTGCDEPTVTYGRGAYVRAGGTVSRKVLWGLELFKLLDERFRAGEEETPLTIENTTISPVVLWFPWQGGLFLKGGIGITTTAVTTPGIDGAPSIGVRGRGSSLNFGIGLDVPLHRTLAITTNFGIYYSAVGDVPVTGSIVDDVITTVYQANFAITLR